MTGKKANLKIQIYKGIIQYLLESTHYTLKNIAELSSSSIQDIRSIYYEDSLQLNITSELKLATLYHLILEINLNNEQMNKKKYVYRIK
ncbi:MAG: hypothetical protein H0U75_00580 [Legionella sp.]|nr:hypothetical protein [Legionella sp.]